VAEAPQQAEVSAGFVQRSSGGRCHEREVFVVSRHKKNGFFALANILVEEEFGVSATCRNWSTVSKIAQWMRTEAEG
jgi:hypothetical protein